jgi:hypothetical protein
MPLAPLQADVHLAVPARRSTPGTSSPEPTRMVQDPEAETLPEKRVPVSLFPPTAKTPIRPTRKRTFVPARRVPEREPVSMVPTGQVEQPPVQEIKPAPTPIRHDDLARVQKPKNSPENSDKNSPRGEFLSEFSGKGELTSNDGGVAKPTMPLVPKFTTKLFDKPPERKKRGRQRAKDRHSAADGVRQLFELWWLKANGRLSFGQFYRHHLSKDMRSYYTREYIYGRNATSHAEYRQWRAAWDARHASASA